MKKKATKKPSFDFTEWLYFKFCPVGTHKKSGWRFAPTIYPVDLGKKIGVGIRFQDLEFPDEIIIGEGETLELACQAFDRQQEASFGDGKMVAQVGSIDLGRDGKVQFQILPQDIAKLIQDNPKSNLNFEIEKESYCVSAE